MFQVVVEIKTGEIIYSNIVVSLHSLERIKQHLLKSPQVRNVYATQSLKEIPNIQEGLDEFINNLVW